MRIVPDDQTPHVRFMQFDRPLTSDEVDQALAWWRLLRWPEDNVCEFTIGTVPRGELQ